MSLCMGPVLKDEVSNDYKNGYNDCLEDMLAVLKFFMNCEYSSCRSIYSTLLDVQTEIATKAKR